MATSILDTGEAYLSPADKRFIRIGAREPAIRHDVTVAISPTVTGALVALAIASVAVAALIG